MIDRLKMRLEKENMFLIAVKAHPGASKTQVRDVMDDGTWKIDLAAPAQDGRANAELVRFLAEELNLPKANITIVTGLMNARKGVKIVGKSR